MKIRVCNRCKRKVSKSSTPGYKYQCFKCDEDLYSFETTITTKTVNENVGYFSPLRIPEAKSGKCYIKHSIEKKGTHMTIVSVRQSFFGENKKPSKLLLQQDMLVHKLCEGKSFDGADGVWMSDCPQEIVSQQHVIDACEGDVLVGGLGLGWIATMLDQSDRVKSVTVVERNSDVINLVWKHLDVPKTKLVQGDLMRYLKRIKGKRSFDWAYYDIWAPNGESVLDEFIRPLRTLSEGIVEQERIINWEEDVMLGQIKFHLANDIQLWDEPMPFGRYKNLSDEDFARGAKWLKTQWSFLNWMRQTKPTKDQAMEALEHYVRTYPQESKWLGRWGEWAFPQKGKK